MKEAVHAVVAHMHDGKGGRRKGDKRLVVLLEEARAGAASAGEWQVVRLLQDSLDYAEGRLNKPDFEERYRLFQQGQARNPHLRDSLAGTLQSTFLQLAESGAEFLERRPGATPEEFRAHFRALSSDAGFLTAPEERPGRYEIPRGATELALWLEEVLRERVDVVDVRAEARRIALSPRALEVLAADEDGQVLLRAAEQQRRAADLAALRAVVEDRTATEHDLQKALEGQHWIFGGRYVGEAARRRLVPGDEVDIPLIRGDGSLHVVELKRSMSLRRNLVKPHRGGWVPTSDVNDAVGQAINYLTGLDEDRHRIMREHGIETRRAGALVLIGHPGLQPEVPEQEVNEALRTLNTHVARVEVLTYKELVDNAERSVGGPVAVARATGP